MTGSLKPLHDQAMIAAERAPTTRYSYKMSLMGAAHQFELTDEGLYWRVAGRSGRWPYAGIAAIRLSYRPTSMQSHRYRADIETSDGLRLAIYSTNWQTVSLMTPQDRDYSAFITQLHERMKRAGSQAVLNAGLRQRIYAAAVGMLTLVAIALSGLFVRAVLTGAWAGALFLVGFAALFAWQIGGFIRRNRPRAYTLEDVPAALLP